MLLVTQTNSGKMCGGRLPRVGIRRQGLLGAIMEAVYRIEAGQLRSGRTASPLRQLAESVVWPPRPYLLAAGPFITVCLGPRWLVG